MKWKDSNSKGTEIEERGREKKERREKEKKKERREVEKRRERGNEKVRMNQMNVKSNRRVELRGGRFRGKLLLLHVL